MRLRHAVGPVPIVAVLALSGCLTPAGSNYYVPPGGQVAPIASYDPITLGTGVEWLANPEEAHERARAEEKLVLVLHLSGNFESAEET